MPAEAYLKRKVGPLKMYQWIGLGVIAGLGLLIYNSRKGAGEPEGEVFGGTGTGAFGPINPETGVPFAFEGGTGAGTESPVQSIGDVVDLIGTLKEIFSPEETNTEPADAPAADPLPTTGAKKKAKKTRQQRREDKDGAGHKKKHDKPKKHPATSTGAAGSTPQAHQAAPHPVARIGQAVGVVTQHTAIAPAHAVGNSRPAAAPARRWVQGHWQGTGKARHWVEGHYA